MTRIYNQKRKIIVCEYFNNDILKQSNAVIELLNITKFYYLQPTINSPTRITPTSKSLLDQVFINKNVLDHENTILHLVSVIMKHS